jgi:PAS domain S-box-containing protein
MRRESIESLRLSEERFRTLKTAMTPGVFVATAGGGLIGELAWWWEKQTGQTPEQSSGFGWLDMVHPGDKTAVLDVLQSALRSRTPYQIECKVRQRDGAYRYVRVQGAPVCDGNGNVHEWIGTLFDIDDQRKTEEALHLSEERHRTFMATTALTVWTTTPDGEMVSDLYGWEELTGQTPEQYRGFGWMDAVHPDDKPAQVENWRQALRDGARPVDSEYRVRRKDGTYCHVRDHGVALRHPDGTVREWIGTVVDIDAKKRAEEALRTNEERYRILTAATTSAVWHATASGGIDEECPGWEHFTGQSFQQYKGWGWMNFLPPDDRRRTSEIWQRSLINATPFEVDYRIIRRDGSLGYVRARGAPVLNADGSVREWIGTIVDIDNEKRAEEALRASEEEFRANFQLAGIGQAQTDPRTGRYLRVNSKFSEMVGYSEDELLTMTCLDITHAEDRPAEMKGLLDLLRGEIGKFTSEIRFVRKDGSILWGLMNRTMAHDVHRRPLRTITMVEDITERKQSEALAVCQKKALEMVTQGALLGEVLDFIALEVEKQTTVECRASIQVLVEPGNRGRLCAAPSLPESYRKAVATFPIDSPDAPGALTVFLERTVIVPDLVRTELFEGVANQLTPYGIRSMWCAPIISSGQKHLGSFCLYSFKSRIPGTAQQKMLESVNQTIALVIERKQAEAGREELLVREQAAREQAQAANRMKDEFLAVVSHELRTPLNAINGWTYMLLNAPMDSASQSRALHSILRQVRSQCQLIDDLLDVARIVSGKLRLDLLEVDPSRVINAALDVVRPAAEANQIQLVADLAPGPLTVSADPERLQQVIWNLLSNAIKFTPSGGRVELRSRRCNSCLEIVVADTGQGISEDFLPYVFDRFRQADVSTTRTRGGIGLGLAIVRHLIDLHGGSIFAASPGKGQGSTFTIRLPLLSVQTAESNAVDRKQRPDALRSISAGDGEMLKGLRVMVVEDNSEDRGVLSAALAHEGATVSASATAPEALGKLDQFQPDVLVADIGMPGEDGYSLIRKVRACPPDHGGITPAIALTAYAGDANRKLALEAGYQKHMTKPADPNELAQTIAQLSRVHTG